MAKIYSKKNPNCNGLKPKKETISFLLQYSKALTVLKTTDQSFEILAN